MSTPHDRNKATSRNSVLTPARLAALSQARPSSCCTPWALSLPRSSQPVAYVLDGDRFVIVASKGGAPTNPGWYHNILARPHVTVEIGLDHFPVVASVATEPERTRLYDKMIAMMPVFAEYRLRTNRVIPVIILRRKDPEAS